MRRKHGVGFCLAPKGEVIFVRVVAQVNLLVRQAAGVEFGDEGRGVGLGFGRDVEGEFIQPLVVEQGVEIAVTQVVGAVKEKPARGGGVEQFPQATWQLAVVQFGRRQGRVTEPGKNFTRRAGRGIFRRIVERWRVVGHGRFLASEVRGGDGNVAPETVKLR